MICFSIVIPIYNAESSLKRCVNSVLEQTYQNNEIILVNDGSTDGSGELCDYYNSYNCVRVVNKDNGGVSSARNAGIEVASGEYVLFLDADDYFDHNVCEKLSEAITIAHCPDCLDFGIKYVNSSGEAFAVDNKIKKNTLLNRNYLDEFILPSLLCIEEDSDHFIWEYVWNKAYKLEIIKKNKTLFDESRRKWEDKPFLLDYLRFCHTYYSVDNCYYNYVNTVGSLSQKYDADFFDTILSNYSLYKEWYGNQFDFDTPYVNGYWCRSIEKMILRFFGQQENEPIVEQTIYSALQNKTVKEWYKNRPPENKEEETANKLMGTGDIQGLISFYKTWSLKEQRTKKKNPGLLQRGKNKIKSLLRS